MIPPEWCADGFLRNTVLVLMQVPGSLVTSPCGTGEFCGKTEALPQNATLRLFEDKSGGYQWALVNFSRTFEEF